MQPLERGRVVWVKPGSAEIELVLTPKCKQCSACEISSSGKIIIEADNQAGAKNGDLVELQVSPAAINLFPLIFLGVPIFCFFIGTLIGNYFSERVGIILGFVLMVIGFAVVQVGSRLRPIKSKFGNKIVRII